MNIIRRLVGNLTLPKEVHVDSLGGKYVRVYGIPSYDFEERKYYVKYKSPYQYQLIEQDWKGVWKQQCKWYGLNNPLPEFVNIKEKK